MKIGIVGLPNAGKSTLFNALTAAGAETGDYPFTTIDPNVAVVEVPDERLDQIAEIARLLGRSSARRSSSTTSPGSSGRLGGRGARQPVPGSIRETDAICHVARAHGPAAVAHPEGRIDPVADAELVETELLAADLESAERRLEKVSKEAKSGDKEAVAERDWLEAVVDALGSGRPAREVPLPEAARDALRKLSPLTVEAGPLRGQRRRGRGRGAARPRGTRRGGGGGRGRGLGARVEAELRELDAAGGRGDARRARHRSVGARAPDPRRLRAARPGQLLHGRHAATKPRRGP